MADAVELHGSMAREGPLTSGRRRGAPVVSATCLGIIVSAALLASGVAPYRPTEVQLSEALAPPILAGGTLEHVLGTDALGRDILSRLIFGARISLTVGLITTGSALLLGGLLGLVAGFYRGWIESVIMRFVDVTLSLPTALIGIAAAFAFRPTVIGTATLLTLLLWPRWARQAHAEALTIRELDYVALAHVSGRPPWSIALRHVAPNIANTLVVLSTLQIGWIILVESSLAFLGAGVPPPTPSWGNMVAEGREQIFTAWWVSLVPGAAIFITVLSLNVVGDWIRQRLDPLGHVRPGDQ